MHDFSLNFCFSVLYPNRAWFRLLFSYYNFATPWSILSVTFILEAKVNVDMGKGRQDTSPIQTASRT